MMVVGYFNWRRTMAGGVTCEKIAREHRDPAVMSRDRGIVDAYRYTLIREYALDHQIWNKSLNELAWMFPCPEYARNAD